MGGGDACGECGCGVGVGVCESVVSLLSFLVLLRWWYVGSMADDSTGFKRPFLNYYGLNFVLYELSTPFLNIHWFLDKCRMTGSRFQLVNGIALIASFGASRLVWGSYQTVNMYRDVWRALQTPGELPVPPWLALAYLVANTMLSGLNFWWFSRMIVTVRKRFEKPREKVNKKEN